MDQAQVVITVPRAKKGAWVAASRAQGCKLTDWLIERIDATSEASAPCAPAQPAAHLTAPQFNVLAALMRLGADTPRGRALRAVLCDGVPVASAARAEGIAHQPVYRAVESAKKTLALAESCVCGSVP
jgi:hypothetical protein